MSTLVRILPSKTSVVYMEPDTHPSFDIVKGGKRKKVSKPDKLFGDLKPNSVKARERLLNLKHNTRRIKDTEMLVTHKKKQDLRIAPSEKLKTMKQVIKKNTSVKVNPKSTFDQSVQKIRTSVKSREIPQTGLGLALTKTKLNNLVSIPSNARIDSTRTTVKGSIVHESKQQALNLQGMRDPTNILNTSITELPREASIHALLKQEVAQYPDKIKVVGGSLSGFEIVIRNVAYNLKECIEGAADITQSTTNARRDADKARKTLGDDSSGKIHDHKTLSATVAAHSPDPRIEFAITAAKDADIFRNRRDSNDDPSQNGLHNKINSDASRNQAHADSFLHETAMVNAATRKKDNISGMSSKQNEHETFVRGLDTPDNAISMHSNNITLVGDNLQSVLNPKKTDAQNAVTRAEGMKEQNEINVERIQGEISNRFSEFRDATKNRDACAKDIKDINSKLSNLTTESAGYKNDLDKAEAGLSNVEHDPIHDDKFTRLEQIRDKDLAGTKNALREAGKRRYTAVKAKGYLAPNKDIPDIELFNANSKDIRIKLTSVIDLYGPEIENKALIDKSIRTRITERDVINQHLGDIKARIHAYEPTKPIKDSSPPRTERKDDVTMLADRDMASSLINSYSKKNAVQGAGAKDVSGILSANTAQYAEAATGLSNLSQKREINSEMIEVAKTNRFKYDSAREGVKADIEGFVAAQKKVFAEVANVLSNSTSITDTINSIKEEQAILNNGVVDAIKNMAGDALTTSRDAKIQAQIRDAAKDTAIGGAKDMDIINRARNEAENDAKIHNTQSNNAAKRLVDAKSGDSSAKSRNIAEDMSQPGSTSKYNEALTEVDANLASLMGDMNKAAGMRSNAERLERGNVKNIDKCIAEVNTKSAEFGTTTRLHAKDLDDIAECMGNLEHLANKPATLKGDVDAAFARAETNRPKPNVDLGDRPALVKQMKDEYTAKLRESILRHRDAEESLKGLSSVSTKPNPKIAEKVTLDKTLKEAYDKENAKLELIKKNKKPVDEDLAKKLANKNRLVTNAGNSLLLVGNLMNFFLTPEIISNSVSSSITPESEPAADNSLGSDYTDGYNLGMTQGKIEGQKDGSKVAKNIISRMDTEPVDTLIKEVEKITNGDENLEAATVDVLKGVIKGTMKGGYEEDENGTMIPKMEIYEGGASPTEDFDDGYFTAYNYAYKLWYNATIQVTMSLRDEASATSATLWPVNTKPVETSLPLSVPVESSDKPSASGGGLKNAKRNLKRGNTFKQHEHLLGQIKGKTISV